MRISGQIKNSVAVSPVLLTFPVAAAGPRLLRFLLAVLFCFFATAAPAADFSLSNFNLESSERVSGIPATWDPTYRVEFTNLSGEDLTEKDSSDRTWAPRAVGTASLWPCW